MPRQLISWIILICKARLEARKSFQNAKTTSNMSISCEIAEQATKKRENVKQQVELKKIFTVKLKNKKLFSQQDLFYFKASSTKYVMQKSRQRYWQQEKVCNLFYFKFSAFSSPSALWKIAASKKKDYRLINFLHFIFVRDLISSHDED